MKLTYAENKIIGVNEYDGDKQDSNTARENMTKNQSFG